MKTYIKNGIVKKKNTIVIYKDDVQIINPTHETLIENGWVEYVTPTLTDEQKLDFAKQAKIDEINMYDKSIAIESFSVNSIDIWFDKSTRAGLKLRFESEIALNKEMTTLWYEDQSFTLPLNTAIQMLYALEVYASECYDNTHYHISNVKKMTSIDEINLYDYTTGYPDKLEF